MMCRVSWCYSTASCELLWSVRVSELVGGAPSSVVALRHLPALRRLALALSCGRYCTHTRTRAHTDTHAHALIRTSYTNSHGLTRI